MTQSNRLTLSFGNTNKGKFREKNEDFFYIFDHQSVGHLSQYGEIFIVTDGVGGNVEGRWAAETTVNTIVDVFYSARQSGGAVSDALRLAIDQANQKVFQYAQSIQAGVSCTLAVAVIFQENLTVAHAGDARVYVLRDGSSRLTQLTQDHSWVAEQFRAGILTEEEAERHELRNVITRAVGNKITIQPEVNEFGILKSKDQLLLCSDGLYGSVSAPAIISILNNYFLEDSAFQLVGTAINTAQDNVTAVVAIVDGVNLQAQRHQSVTIRGEDFTRPIEAIKISVDSQDENHKIAQPILDSKNTTKSKAIGIASKSETIQPKNDNNIVRNNRILYFAMLAIVIGSLIFLIGLIAIAERWFSSESAEEPEAPIALSPTRAVTAFTDEPAPTIVVAEPTSTISPPLSFVGDFDEGEIALLRDLKLIQEQDGVLCTYALGQSVVYFWEDEQIENIKNGHSNCAPNGRIESPSDQPVTVNLDTAVKVQVDLTCLPLVMVQVEPDFSRQNEAEFESAYVFAGHLLACSPQILNQANLTEIDTMEEILFE